MILHMVSSARTTLKAPDVRIRSRCSRFSMMLSVPIFLCGLSHSPVAAQSPERKFHSDSSPAQTKPGLAVSRSGTEGYLNRLDK